MAQQAARLEFSTPGKALIDITADIASWVEDSGIATGLLTLFCQHTSASLLVTENASPEVLDDLLAWLDTTAPEGPHYAHDLEGPDDMPAHVKAALTGPSLSIPVADGRMMLGTWQGIFLAEHRAAPHRRTLAAHLSGE